MAYDSFTKLNLHFDGVDESTTFTDSATGKTVTAVGNAQIDTAQSVFGGASGLFDGTGDYLTLADSSDWDWGTSDFCVETRARFTALPTTGQFSPLLYRGSSSYDLWWQIYNNAGVYELIFKAFTAAIPLINVVKSLPGLSVDTWYGFAISRVGNYFYEFQDGSLLGTPVAGNPDLTKTGILNIARHVGDGTYFNGHLDELRISVGHGRYSSSYPLRNDPFSGIEEIQVFNAD